MKSRSRSVVCCLALDLPILLGVAATIALLELGVIPFNKSGYFCQDDALSFRFVGDTVSMSFLVVSALAVPFIMLWPAEAMLYRPSEYSMKKCRWLESLKSASLWYRDCMYGLFFNLLLVEIMKMTMGNPRPTFFDICQPVPSDRANCTKGVYVPSFTCTSTKYSDWFQIDASHSFPSGHTSASVHSALFVAWYLQRRAFSWRNRSVFAVPFLQLSCLTYAVACSLTRITDHRHHWWDVLAGTVIGVLSMLYSVLILCQNFRCPTVSSTSDISSSDSSTHNRRLLNNSEHTLPHAHIRVMP